MAYLIRLIQRKHTSNKIQSGRGSVLYHSHIRKEQSTDRVLIASLKPKTNASKTKISICKHPTSFGFSVKTSLTAQWIKCK